VLSSGQAGRLRWSFPLASAAPSVERQAEGIANRERELRRLAEYERRAFSSLKKALSRLDYERAEAERRRGADADRPRACGGRDVEPETSGGSG
jgi:hypothetical protein